MEAMDLDSSCSYRSQSRQSPCPSPPVSPSATELSDMEVDPNSPRSSINNIHWAPHTQPSTAQDHNIEDCLDKLVNAQIFRNCQSAPPMCGSPVAKKMMYDRNNGYFNSDKGENKCIVERPKTSIAISSMVAQKQKAGYGLKDDDEAGLTFSHYPNFTPKSKLGEKDQLRNRIKNRNGFQEPSDASLLVKSLKGENSEKQSQKKGTVRGCCIVMLKFFFICLILGVFLLYVAQKGSNFCTHKNFFQNEVLEVDLRSDLFGQHIASDLIKKHINRYFHQLARNSKSSAPSQAEKTADAVDHKRFCKPLVLSLHGWTGVGKNFASQIISQSFTSVNTRSFVIPLLFPHIEMDKRYGREIEEWIVSNVTDCSANVFIVDEMDKSSPGVQDGLLKSIRSLTNSCSSSAPVIFLLISNTHATAINKVFIEISSSSAVRNRLAVKENNFHSVFKSSQSEWYTGLSSAGLIDTFIPFMPLEREHVVECIKRDLIARHFSTDNQVIDKVLKELSFSTYGELQLSKTGCKRVSDKVNFVIYSSDVS